eukprot:EG_transcript_28465
MTTHRPPLVTDRMFPWTWNSRYYMMTPLATYGREDIFANPHLPADKKLHAAAVEGGEFMKDAYAPPHKAVSLVRRVGRKAMVGAGLYFHLFLMDKFVSKGLLDRNTSPYFYMTLYEKAIYCFLPNKNKPNEEDLLKLFREARLESNYKSVSMWTYRLRSERVPKSYFDKPPVSYDADRRTSGFVEWAFWMVGLESFGKSVVPEAW